MNDQANEHVSRWSSSEGKKYFNLILKYCSDEDKLRGIAKEYFGFSEDYVDLRGISFCDLDLEGACFSYCDMAFSKFKGAQVKSSEFHFTNLCRSTFSNSKFMDCYMVGAMCNEVTIETCVFEKSSLNSAAFKKSNIKGLLIDDGDFMSSDFSGSNIEGVKIIGEVWFKSSVLPKSMKSIIENSVESKFAASIQWV